MTNWHGGGKTDVHKALELLEHQAAKIAGEEDEDWRLEHAEFMDALAYAGEILRPIPKEAFNGRPS